MAYDAFDWPAERAVDRGNRQMRRSLGFFTIAVVAGAVPLIAVSSGPLRVLGSLAAMTVALVAYRLANRAEHRVGAELGRLAAYGFTPMHDRLVSGPTGLFLIETKSGRRAAAKAKRRAKQLHDRLGVFVTPIICLVGRRSDYGPLRHENVWVVGVDRLNELLLRQRRRPVDVERVARLADSR